MNTMTQTVIGGFTLSVLAALVTLGVISASVLLWVFLI